MCVWGVYFYTHTERREKRREEGEGRKGRAVWAKEGDDSKNNLCQVQAAETQLKLVSTVKEKNKVCVVLCCGRLQQPKTMLRDAVYFGLWALPPPPAPQQHYPGSAGSGKGGWGARALPSE